MKPILFLTVLLSQTILLIAHERDKIFPPIARFQHNSYQHSYPNTLSEEPLLSKIPTTITALEEVVIPHHNSNNLPVITENKTENHSFFANHKKTMWRMLWGATGLTIAGLAVHGAMIVHNSASDAAAQCDQATKNCANSASICNGVLSSLGTEAQLALNFLQSIIGESGQAQYYIQMIAQNITSLISNINSLEEQSSIVVDQNKYLQQQLAQCQAQCPPHTIFK
jgi:hypothetical protein